MIVAAGLHFLMEIHIFDSLPASPNDAGFCALIEIYINFCKEH